ncbi:flagellar motor switch protein FliM [Devosia subaequoris]|uniref:Flagellar motor switch protein FliM n=1 Tax=Devosia subaequoris TaxID=395930 RepID=A0A7W6IJU6_9HYPH|nr:hypothetical protein [Devosia subaequoris]MBB4050973.1 flagellar motor switch protein FliM [Devosia subaequoris]MCP1208358.1 hypothetical protein [Devosia subaequoris]
MATVVRLSQEQIDQLLDEADNMEKALKNLHEELVEVGTPRDTISRFSRVHDRFTSIVAFLRRQRELGA